LLKKWRGELGGDDEAVQAYTAALYALKQKAGILTAPKPDATARAFVNEFVNNREGNAAQQGQIVRPPQPPVVNGQGVAVNSGQVERSLMVPPNHLRSGSGSDSGSGSGSGSGGSSVGNKILGSSVSIGDSELQAEYVRQCRRCGRLFSLFASFQKAEMLLQEVLVEAEKDASMTFDLTVPDEDLEAGGQKDAKKHKSKRWSKESSYWAGALMCSCIIVHHVLC
jgi:hypothetical protein